MKKIFTWAALSLRRAALTTSSFPPLFKPPRPILDVWAELDLDGGICHSMAVKDSVFIDRLVKMIFRPAVFHIQLCCRSQVTLIRRRRCDGTGIHQCYGRDLSALQLGPLSVGEITGGMTNGKSVVAGRVARSEAGTAERSFHDGARSIGFISEKLDLTNLQDRFEGYKKVLGAHGYEFRGIL